ncbi:MAG TPA: alpha/beta hydrolase [Anaerolineales bacterium]|nr:alpha/beta hydrolase [Anaerolineales bacterium]
MECQLDNLSVHNETIGQGKPFVTISGIPSDHRIIKSWMEPIFEKRPGWQRIYFDLPGTGRTSGKEITTIDQVLDVVCNFIDAVIPNQRFTLLGLSAGGYLARGVVAQKAELMDGLCLLVPWLSEHEDQELPSPVTRFKDSAALAQLSPEDAERLASLAVVQDQKLVDWYRDVVRPARQGSNRSMIEKRIYSFDLDALTRPFEKPTLILMGRQDTHVGYKDGWDILETYPRATFAVLDRAGHALGVEQEGVFQALLNEWLERVEEAQPDE